MNLDWMVTKSVRKRGSLLVEALGQFPLEVEQEAGPDPDHEDDETHGDDDGAGGGPALLLLLGPRLLALLLAGAGRCSRGLLLAALVGVVVVSPRRGCGGGHRGDGRGGGGGSGGGGGGGYVHTHAELFLKLTIMRFSVDSISKDVVLVVYRNKKFLMESLTASCFLMHNLRSRYCKNICCVQTSCRVFEALLC